MATWNGWETDFPEEEAPSDWLRRMRDETTLRPTRAELLAEATARLDALCVIAIEAQRFFERAAEVGALPPHEHAEFCRLDLMIFKLLGELEEPAKRIKDDQKKEY